MSITVSDDPENLARAKTTVEKTLAKLVYKPGKTYAEFRPGDKVAEYGLAGLVAVGAGAAAVKLGLFAGLLKILAKGGKAIVAGIVALGAGIAKLFGGGSRKGPMSGGDAPPPPAA